MIKRLVIISLIIFFEVIFIYFFFRCGKVSDIWHSEFHPPNRSLVQKYYSHNHKSITIIKSPFLIIINCQFADMKEKSIGCGKSNRTEMLSLICEYFNLNYNHKKFMIIINFIF